MFMNLTTKSVMFIVFLVLNEKSLSIIPAQDETHSNDDVNSSELSKLDSDFHHKLDKDDTIKDKLLKLCNQTNVLQFDEVFTAKALKNYQQIGEGFFGYVYRYGKKVIKVEPVGTTDSGIIIGKYQRSYTETYAEIVVATALSALRTPLKIDNNAEDKMNFNVDEIKNNTSATDVFNEVLGIHFVEGIYPSTLLELSKLNASTPENQQYMVLDLAFAGLSLENYIFASEKQAYALFQQVAFGLATAEEVLQFEHRDLHWNNILITSTEEVNATFVLKGKVYNIPREGVSASIIDFSHSRITLNKTCIFTQRLALMPRYDDDPDYKFRIFPLQDETLGGDWKKYDPFTNILWLHYTLHQMVTAVKFKINNKEYIEKLKQTKEKILVYKSVTEYVVNEIAK